MRVITEDVGLVGFQVGSLDHSDGVEICRVPVQPPISGSVAIPVVIRGSSQPNPVHKLLRHPVLVSYPANCALYSPVIPATILIGVEIVQVPRRVEGSHPPVGRKDGQVDQDYESHGSGAPENEKVVDQNGEGLFENPGRNVGLDALNQVG